MAGRSTCATVRTLWQVIKPRLLSRRIAWIHFVLQFAQIAFENYDLAEMGIKLLIHCGQAQAQIHVAVMLVAWGLG